MKKYLLFTLATFVYFGLSAQVVEERVYFSSGGGSNSSMPVSIGEAFGGTSQNITIGSQQGAAIFCQGVTLNITSTIQDASCFDEANGAITISVNGGSSPYTYLWSNGSTNQNLSDLSSGSYSVVVADVNGCSITSTSFIINSPQEISVSNTSTDISCFDGENGNIILAVSGGNLPYTYLWSNGSTTQNLSNVSAGTYSATITDGNGCSFNTDLISLVAPSELQSSVDNITSDTGNNDGSIDITISGGTPPYSYNWSNGSTSEDLSNLNAGDYSCAIIDNNNCVLNVNSITVDIVNSVNGTLTDNERIVLFPNPIDNELNVQFINKVPNQYYSVILFDSKGAEILKENTEANTITLSTEAIPAGNYVVSVIAKDKQTIFTQQIIKK